MNILNPALMTHLGLAMVGLTKSEKYDHAKWLIDFACKRYDHQYRDHIMSLFGKQWRTS
jgi:hypothetical protein